MKRSLLCLLAAALMLPLQAQVGYLLTTSSINDLPTENGQKPEQNAAQWFQTEFVTPGKGRMLSLSQLAAGIDTASIKVLWVNIDRVGLSSLDAAGINSSVVLAIRQFVEKGGRLFLTKQANTLTYSIGRMGYAPSWSNGDYMQGGDIWTINPHLGIDPNISQDFDRSHHAVFQGLQQLRNNNFYKNGEQTIYYPTFPLVGAVARTDNNIMWVDMYRRNPMTGGQMAEKTANNDPQTLLGFEEDWNCTVLAVWGQVLDFCAPGLIEFKPTGSYKGTILSCGFAAYQWGSSNNYLNNVKQLTLNALNYLLANQTSTESKDDTTTVPVGASTRIYMTMEPTVNGRLVEQVSKNTCYVTSATDLDPISVPGAVGRAWRTDAYTNSVAVPVTAANLSARQLTYTLWCAAQTYPMMKVDTYVDETMCFAGTLNDDARSGFGFQLSSIGTLSFACYAGGQKVTVVSPTKMPLSRWCRLVATMDADARIVKFYINGALAGTATMPGEINHGSSTLFLGRGRGDKMMGPFRLNTFNGILDEVRIDNGIWSASEIAGGNTPEHAVDWTLGEEVFADDIYRPRFHGMPAMNWTNECHGLTYSDGRFHVFFQKNGNGPYMSRLNWGHISSSDLCSWREEPVAIAPGTGYDGKGCWSGCVFTDPNFNSGKTTIIYTGVDNAKASMNMASPTDASLLTWVKAVNNPVVSGTPAGYSADFRDPYYFRANGKSYLIVGTSRNNVGSTCLFEWANGQWNHLGPFYTGVNSNSCGTFFEMPNITPMGNNKWLFTATPLGTGNGVRTLYWVGSINSNGTFAPLESTPKTVDLAGMNKHGYGLLSPSIYNHNGTIIAMGIVPDKVSGEFNARRGWAHCYSLPREWSLDAQNRLIQKPYSGLTALRNGSSFMRQNVQLNGALALEQISGRQVEVKADYVLNGHEVGMRLMKTTGGQCVKISYNSGTNNLTVDFASLDHEVNDGGVFNGHYSTTLPEGVTNGQTLRLHAFLDHSVLDLFVNDKWATSIRLFIHDRNANGVEIYANGQTTVSHVEAYMLEATEIPTGMFATPAAQPMQQGTYDLMGRPTTPTPGIIYIENGKTHLTF